MNRGMVNRLRTPGIVRPMVNNIPQQPFHGTAPTPQHPQAPHTMTPHSTQPQHQRSRPHAPMTPTRQYSFKQPFNPQNSNANGNNSTAGAFAVLNDHTSETFQYLTELMMAILLDAIQLYNAQYNIPDDFTINHLELYRLDIVRRVITPTTFSTLSSSLLDALSPHPTHFWSNLKQTLLQSEGRLHQHFYFLPLNDVDGLYRLLAKTSPSSFNQIVTQVIPQLKNYGLDCPHHPQYLPKQSAPQPQETQPQQPVQTTNINLYGDDDDGIPQQSQKHQPLPTTPTMNAHSNPAFDSPGIPTRQYNNPQTTPTHNPLYRQPALNATPSTNFLNISGIPTRGIRRSLRTPALATSLTPALDHSIARDNDTGLESLPNPTVAEHDPFNTTASSMYGTSHSQEQFLNHSTASLHHRPTTTLNQTNMAVVKSTTLNESTANSTKVTVYGYPIVDQKKVIDHLSTCGNIVNVQYIAHNNYRNAINYSTNKDPNMLGRCIVEFDSLHAKGVALRNNGKLNLSGSLVGIISYQPSHLNDYHVTSTQFGHHVAEGGKMHPQMSSNFVNPTVEAIMAKNIIKKQNDYNKKSIAIFAILIFLLYLFFKYY